MIQNSLWKPVKSVTDFYTIEAKLSPTVQGAVYRARCKKTGTLVAIKAVHKSSFLTTDTRGGQENIQTELVILKALMAKHTPGIVQLYDALMDDRSLYLVMFLEQGGDLFEYAVNHSPLAEAEARRLFVQIVDAVSNLHGKGICHLDLSLENILLTEHGEEVKLCDFGVARACSSYDDKFQSFVRVGKLKYMAPEIALLREFNGFEADVYSLGVILFCLLYGFHPYDAPDAEDDPIFGLICCGEFDQALETLGVMDSKSMEAEDLLNKMMCWNDERISLQEVRNHPWMNPSRDSIITRSSSEPAKVPLDDSAQSSSTSPSIRRTSSAKSLAQKFFASFKF